MWLVHPATRSGWDMLTLREIGWLQRLDPRDEPVEAQRYGVGFDDDVWDLCRVPVRGLTNWQPEDVLVVDDPDGDCDTLAAAFLKGTNDPALAPPPIIVIDFGATTDPLLHGLYGLGGYHRLGAAHLAGLEELLAWVAFGIPD